MRSCLDKSNLGPFSVETKAVLGSEHWRPLRRSISLSPSTFKSLILSGDCVAFLATDDGPSGPMASDLAMAAEFANLVS